MKRALILTSLLALSSAAFAAHIHFTDNTKAHDVQGRAGGGVPGHAIFQNVDNQNWEIINVPGQPYPYNDQVGLFSQTTQTQGLVGWSSQQTGSDEYAFSVAGTTPGLCVSVSVDKKEVGKSCSPNPTTYNGVKFNSNSQIDVTLTDE